MKHELVTLNDNNVPTTTSLKVADRFGKRHDNVIQKIESLECSIEFARLNFQVSEYQDITGRFCKMYELTRDGFSFLVNKMQGAKASLFTENFIGAFNAMEATLSGEPEETFQIPKTLSEALMLAAKQAEQIELQAPKVEAFETYLDTDGTMSLTAAAKALGMTAHRLGKMLRDDEVFFHKNYASMKANLPRAGYEEYFKVVRVKPPTQNTTYPQTRVTPAGLEWLRQNYTAPYLKVV